MADAGPRARTGSRGPTSSPPGDTRSFAPRARSATVRGRVFPLGRSIVAAVVVLLSCSSCHQARRAGPVVKAVSPRIVSDQTSYPLTLYGTAFAPGMTVRITGAGGS